MIIDTLLSWIINGMIGLLSLLPDKNPFPSGFDTAFDWLSDIVSSIVYTLNGADGVGSNLIVIFLLFLSFEFSMFVWSGVKFIINVIRGSGA